MGEVGDGFNVAKKMRDGGNFEMAEYSPQQSIIIIYFKLHSACDLLDVTVIVYQKCFTLHL